MRTSAAIYRMEASERVRWIFLPALKHCNYLPGIPLAKPECKSEDQGASAMGREQHEDG